jgi:C-terminal processing protease CtpA/Prc
MKILFVVLLVLSGCGSRDLCTECRNDLAKAKARMNKAVKNGTGVDSLAAHIGRLTQRCNDICHQQSPQTENKNIPDSGSGGNGGSRSLGISMESHERGIRIVSVVEDSAATYTYNVATQSSVSLEPGDIILTINGKFTNSPDQFEKILQSGPPVVSLKIWDARHEVEQMLYAFVGPADEVKAFLKQLPEE